MDLKTFLMSVFKHFQKEKPVCIYFRQSYHTVKTWTNIATVASNQAGSNMYSAEQWHSGIFGEVLVIINLMKT